MNKIINKEHFSEKVFKLEIEAPLIAKSRKAGLYEQGLSVTGNLQSLFV